MRRSIGKKILLLVTVIGVLLIVIGICNVSALSIIGENNDEIAKDIDEYVSAVKDGNQQDMQSLEEKFDSNIETSDIRIKGTYIFDVILVILAVLAIVSVLLIVNLTIARPAKHANSQLDGIMKKIVEGHGDLTERIHIRTKDEVGQLVEGVNGFIENLQEIMRKLQNDTSVLMESANNVIAKVDDSNENASSVSASVQ